MPVILILDTSDKICSVILVVDNKILLKNTTASFEHGRLILFLCEELLQEANLILSDLSVIAFVHGPGSFTGIRIGASVAQGIAMAQGLKIISLPSLPAKILDYKDQEDYQKNYLVPLAIEYWNKNNIINPEDIELVYLNDCYRANLET